MSAAEPIAPSRLAAVDVPAEVARAVEDLAASERGLAREPERLVELRPDLAPIGEFADLVRARLYGDDGFARLSFAPLPRALHRLAYAALGLAIGEPILRYGFLYEVADRGGSHIDSQIPISMTRAATGLHTDSSARDCVPGAVALLCERPSVDGGTSRIADARKACAWLAEHAPEHRARLTRTFIRDVVTPGLDKGLDSLRRNRFPVVRDEPDFEFRYMRFWIERGQVRAGRPLAPEDSAAFDALDAALERSEFGASFRLEAGESLFLDNRRFVHGRDAYDEVPEGGRLLWRMWLDERGRAEETSTPSAPKGTATGRAVS